MGDIDIEVVREEKDLGVIIDTELQFYAQSLAVVNKPNSLIGLIKEGFLKISADMLTSLYKSLV